MKNDKITETFANFIRKLRITTGKTMGQVSRELGITVVYYSEVEAGKKPAFPDGKVDYPSLAKTLCTNEKNLKQMAELDREKRQILKMFGCDSQTADLAVAFGRRLTNNELTEKQIERIQKILNEEA